MSGIGKLLVVITIAVIVATSVLIFEVFVFSTTLIVPDEFPTIQSAVNRASAGDTILIRNGVHDLGTSVVIEKSLTLEGENEMNTIIDGNGDGGGGNSLYYNPPTFKILAPNVVVRDLTFQNFGETVLSVGEEGFGCRIIDNTFESNGGEAISTKGSNNVISGNNMVFNNGGIGIASANADVYGNVISYNNYGVYLQNVGYDRVHNNLISFNVDGILLRMGSYFEVYENEILNNSIYGVYFDLKVYNSRISSNNIMYNGVGIQEEYWTNISNGLGNIVYGNNIVDNTKQMVRNGNATDAISWDNGKVGNYWSDYRSRYPDSTEIDSSGVGNIPYVIDSTYIDHYPLIYQTDIHPMETLLRNATIVVVIVVVLIVSLLLYRKHRRIPNLKL